jgi:hypothetical protein
MVEGASMWIATRVSDAALTVGDGLVPMPVYLALLSFGLIAGTAGSLLATTFGLGDERLPT